MKMFKKNSKGFTLIELLVVIAIIGILSSVVLASLNSARKKGRDARRVSDIAQIQMALELEFDKSRTYPTGNYATAMATLVASKFLAAVPADPLNSGTNVYTYCPISATDYHLSAVLEENLAGGPLASDSDSAVQTCTTGTDVAGTDPTYDKRP